MYAIMHRRRSLRETLGALDRASIAYVSPTYTKRTYVRHVRMWKESHVPMFPGYVFVDGVDMDRWWHLEDRPGKLLMSSGEVVMIQDDVVRRYSCGAVLQEWREGMRIVIVAGDDLMREGRIEEVRGGFATVYFDDGTWSIAAVDTMAPLSV